MTTPNGLAGCWFVLGFTASTRKPTGFINDPVIIDRTMTSGADKRKCANNRKLQVGKRRRMSALIHAAGQHAVFGGERANAVRGRPLRCSVADLFKKFSGSVQSSGRSPGLLWGVAKIISSEA
jgi:hypothetical protein